MDFGSIVVELRKEKGISQTELADKLGIHKNVLGRYEGNEVLPSLEIARNIADNWMYLWIISPERSMWRWTKILAF